MTVFTLLLSQVFIFFSQAFFTAKKKSLYRNKNIRKAFSIVLMMLMVFSPVLSKGENRFCAVTGTATTTATCASAANGTATITLTGDGSGAPGTYTLDGGSSQSFSTNPFTINGLTSGNHTIIATVTAGGCVSGSILFTVSTSGLPIPVISASATPAFICVGSSSTLNASGASTYTWQPGSLTGASVSVSPATTTTYTVTGANADGCSPATTWLRVSSGGNHTLGIKTDGTLWAWGSNDNGQIGDGTLIDRPLPVQIGTANDWAFISGGSFHSLAIKNNGTLWAWGDNATGQLGDGTAIDKLVPVQVGSATNWSFVSAGGSHSIGLRSDGTIWGWGANNYNQVGDGTIVQKNSPVQIGVASNWSKISAGSDHNLAIKTDGTLWAWGRNTNGQLGDGTINGKSTPGQIGSATNWSKIAGCFSHSIALRTDGTLWTWGQNNFGQIGDGTTVQKTSPVQIGTATDWIEVDGGLFYSYAQKSNGTLWSWGYNVYGMLGDGTTVQKTSPIQSGTATNWTLASCGLYHMIGLRTGGTMWSWGWHMNGRLGDGSIANKLTATQVNTQPVSVTVTVNSLPTVSFSGLLSSYCLIAPAVTLTGSPAGGTFSGPGISGNTFTPGTAGAGTHNITYTYTDAFGCTNTSTQSVTVTFTNLLDWVNLQLPGTASYCQGNNLAVYGQLYEPGLTEAPGAGAGVTVDMGYSTVNSNPATWVNWQPATFNVQVGNNDEYVSTLTNLPAGTYYYTFRYAYTQNVCGYQYGGYSAGGGNPWNGVSAVSGVLTVNAPPNIVVTSPSVINMCAGAGTTLIATGAAAYTWMPGSLSGSSVTVNPSVNTTYTVSGTSAAGCAGGVSWIALSAGGYHNLGIKSNGTLWNFGSNLYGQVGDGTNADKLIPVQIGTATNWAAVSAGSFHSLAIKSDGTLWAWGQNANGQVGDGTLVDKTSPVQIGSATNWVAVSAGGNHSVALKADGTLWAWGYNGYGQLGDATFNQRTTPVQIGTATNWASISAGGSQTLAIKTDGTLWSWGRNSSGQLGNGTVNMSNPNLVQVGSAKNWRKITSAFFHSLAIKTDGTLWAWGRNMNGQLGDNTVVDKSSPAQIGVATDWASIDGGLDHTIATKTGGTLWGCGMNTSGQVGDGTMVQRNTFVQIGALTDWLTVDAGTYHSTATKKDGSLYTYGRNMEGQLGDGNILVGSKTPPALMGTLPLSTNVNVVQPVQFTVSASPATICTGSSTTLTASNSSLTYVWTPGNLTGTSVSVSPATTTTYTVVSTDVPNGCHYTTTVTVTVNPLPVVSFTGLPATICNNTPAITLTGNQAPSGTFSGPGISNLGNGTATFTAAFSGGAGVKNITYTYSNGTCSNTVTQQVTVVQMPGVSFTGLPSSMCLNAAAVTLVGAPSGGSFSGPGVSGNTFNPALAGAGGPYSITYSYTDPSTGCSNTSIQTVTVNIVLIVSFTGLPATICNNTPAITLTGNLAPSGTFSGPGINNLGNGTATFTAAFSGGAGVKNITYTYSNGTCSNSVTQQVTVVQMPGVSFTGLPSAMCLNAAAVTLVGAPSGGSFSGPGVTGNTFNPALAGAGGPYSITYSYTDPNTGCTNTSIKTITVNPLPVVSFSGLAANYCTTNAAVTLTGSPVGGTFSGPGISGNLFDPALAGIGTHSVTYTYSNGVCSNAATSSVTVLPNYIITATAATGGNISPQGTTSVCSGNSQVYTITANFGYQISDVLADGISVGAVSTYTFANITAVRTIHAIFIVNCTIPTLSANITSVLCNGGSNAAIDLVLTGGSSPFTFAWTSPGGFTASTEDITGLVAGAYTVMVTATGGCITSATYTVTQPAALVISCSGTNVTCNGANNGTTSVNVNGGTGPYTYSWTDGTGANGSVSIDPSKDNTVYSASTTNSNALGENFAVGKSNSGNTHRSLMAFNISANIPTGSVINAASLSLSVSASSPSAGIQPVYLHKLISDWGEGTSFTASTGIGAPATTNDVTWIHRFYPATNWTNAGGDFVALASAVTNVNSPAFYNWSSAGMVSDIQDWLNTPANNYGWLIKGAETANSQSKRVDSRENTTTANRPVLTVNYTTPNILSTSNTLSNLLPGTYTVIVTDANGCSSSCMYTVTEPAPVVVSFSGLAGPYCTTDASVALTGSPAGGTFSGPGISGNVFTPLTAGAGTHTIIYTYTNGNGCSNTSSQQVTVNTCGSSIAINLKLFLQGYYIDGGIMQPVLNNQVVLNSLASETDSITIELHDPVTFALVDTKMAVLLTNGIVSATFTQPASSYYLVIKHRNTIQTWSTNPVVCTASTPLYDFSIAAGNAMGANQVEVQTGKWAFFTGDLNQDDFIDGNDFPAFDTDSFNGVNSVYAATDMNGDGFVDGNDFPVFDVNSFNGVAAVHP